MVVIVVVVVVMVVEVAVDVEVVVDVARDYKAGSNNSGEEEKTQIRKTEVSGGKSYPANETS